MDVPGAVARNEAMGPNFVWGEERLTIDANIPGPVGPLEARGEEGSGAQIGKPISQLISPNF